MSADACDGLGKCEKLKPILHSKIRTKYALAFGELFINGKQPNSLVGAQFHLAMIAVQHLAYELDSKNHGEIEDIEMYLKIKIWDKNATGTVVDTGEELGRYLDIVLKSTDKDDTRPKWIEIKSLQSTGFSKSYALWAYPRKVVKKLNAKTGEINRREKGLTHKEFLLDRIAATDNELIPSDQDRDEAKLSSDFQWWLLDFKAPKGKKTPKGPSEKQLDNMRNKITRLPTGAGGKTLKISLGFDSADDVSKANAKLISGKKIELFSLKKWIIKDAKAQLLSGIPEDIITSLIGEEQ